MRVLIVAVEYFGPALRPLIPAQRVPACEHAYDPGSGTMPAPGADAQPRVGFPDAQRGWNTPPRAARCPDCDTAVTRIIRGLVNAAVTAAVGHDRNQAAAACPGWKR